ncbi:MAG: carboxypeptidase regulatory-like domain-containing protein [Flavobacteriales bacterium]
MALKKITCIIVLVFFQWMSSDAQVNAGKECLARLDYRGAAEKFERAVKKDSTNAEAWLYLAECYRIMRNYDGALFAFTQAHLLNPGSDKAFAGYIAQLMTHEEYERAAEQTKLFNAQFAGNASGIAFQSSTSRMEEWKKMNANYKIKAININSGKSDITPFILQDKLYYSTELMEAKWVNIVDGVTMLPFYQMHVADGAASTFRNSRLAENLPEEAMHQSSLTMDNQGKLLFYSANRYDATTDPKLAKLALFSSTSSNGTWTTPIQFAHHISGYNQMHPSLSPDGKTLVFCSDMPGGVGGLDIYISTWDGANWTKPVNMGTSINSTGNDCFPSISADGTLFFSSDAHPGIGGLDMYECRKNGNNYDAPAHLGFGVNSALDDFAMTYNSNTKTGYFCSNRTEISSDDIYFFERVCTSTVITITEDGTNSPLEGATVSILEDNKEIGTQVTDPNGQFSRCLNPSKNYEFRVSKKEYDSASGNLSNSVLAAKTDEGVNLDIKLKKKVVNSAEVKGRLVNSSSGQPIANQALTLKNMKTQAVTNMTTDGNGNYTFTNLDLNTDYEISSQVENCGGISQKFNTKDIVGKKTITLDIPIVCKGDVVQLDNIYYDYGKAILRPESYTSLDQVYAVMEANPKMTIEIQSHTDSRGSASFNLKLSQDRAKSAADYLISKGIDKKRVKSKGFGETKILNKCKDGVECSEEEHGTNRRTEFKVINL